MIYLLPLLFSTVQAVPGSTRKLNKRYTDWKGGCQTVFIFRQHDYLYRKSHKKATRIISDFSKDNRKSQLRFYILTMSN